MEVRDYKRWALDGLRERARQREIQVTGRKNEPRLLLRQCDGLLISYQEDWWRSAFKRSGYGGALCFESEANIPQVEPAIVPLLNLGAFFVPMRSPDSLHQVDYFIDRLVQLADWCIDYKLEEFRAMASAPTPALSKIEQATNTLREFPDRQSRYCEN